MSSYLFFLFAATTVGSGINEYFKRNYPVAYYTTCSTIAYNAVYIFSFIQIEVTKIYKYASENIYPVVYPLILSLVGSRNYVEFIHNSCVIHRCNTTMAIKYDEIHSTEYDFILHTIGDYKVIYKKFPLEFKNDVVPCKFSFLIFEVQFEDHISFDIKLNTPGNNYMVAGNVLDKPVIKYILNNKFKVFEFFDEHSYKIYFMDNKINMQSLPENAVILFNDDSYLVNANANANANTSATEDLNLEPSLNDEEPVVPNLETDILPNEALNESVVMRHSKRRRLHSN
jgi:hypothetical protein